MHSFHFLQSLTVILVNFLVLLPILTLAAPPVNPQRATTLDKIDKSIHMQPYTWEQINDEEWVRSQMLRKPKPGKCIFYTTSLSQAAQEWVKPGPDKHVCINGFSETIWELWPAIFYVDAQEDWNPFRDIMNVPLAVRRNTKEYVKTPMRMYFKLMSKVLASECSREAAVMTLDLDDIPTDGIWAEAERPELMGSTKPDAVSMIWVFDPKELRVQLMWNRIDGWKSGFSETGKRRRKSVRRWSNDDSQSVSTLLRRRQRTRWS
ncbi:hypothetical protein EJ08DRAFT_679478 [Tothia fuscella]|uniref:Uncharacterized protein n=1 Tax=Tothia fuscella TaxID=1048955 RepID=A0A9P4NQ09_9PEZI|nr:hypothetical protein EJ08DRAFT_679478 [Tothia fuscella]